MTRVRFTGVVLAVALTTPAGCGHPAGSGTSGAATGGSPAAAGATPSSAGPISGTLTGLYVDVAGGPLFTECGSARQWPVVAGGVSRELELAYLSVRAAPGDAARVTVQAHSTPHSAPGGGTGLVVDKVVLLSGESVCPGERADAPLAGTTWRALSLSNRALDAEEGLVTLRLDAEAETLQASTACRTLSGTFRWVGTQLTFGAIDAGVGRCPAGASTDVTRLDGAVMDVLRNTGSYRIRGDTLELMGEDGVLARFAAAG